MWNLKKNDTTELICKIEIDSQTENKHMVTKGGNGGGINQEFGINRYTTIYKIEKQQGPIVQHRELYSIAYNNIKWKRI